MQAAPRPPHATEPTGATTPESRHNGPVITVRVCCPANLASTVSELLRSNPSTSALVVHPGASITPPGDVIEADLPREAVNAVIEDLMALGVQDSGTIQLLPVTTWISKPGLNAELRTPGSSADAVVWTDVVERAYDESQLTWTYVSFMTLATLLAAIAIVTDSVILVIGAMVLGPEFVAVAALGVGIVRRRWHLFRQGLRTLLLGFAIAIATVALLAGAGRLLGLIHDDQLLTSARPGTSFIFSPNAWSFTIALIAGAAGVLALTSARSGVLVGVFISVTTVPASGNMALALVFGNWPEFWGSAATLAVNISGMALAGWLTLALQQRVWRRTTRVERRLLPLRGGRPRD
ncbi:MAG: DUF389 domain-containing protein [Actinomycetales bacterium]|nr:DUF389 domain-containing protein [Actinomycetales bacterium]